jgi:hypothetical protein
MAPKNWDNDEERRPDPHDSALSVGTNNLGDTAKMRELEEELHNMTDKVASACKSNLFQSVKPKPTTNDTNRHSTAQRFADYENDIRVLTAELRLAKKRNDSVDSTATTESAKTAAAATPTGGLSRFGSFMHSRKTSTMPPTPVSREKELEAQLAQSQTQRLAAEAKVNQMSAEIEELTGSLFSQANEMVADERREAARLRERIKLLEERDAKFAMKVQRIEERDRERKKRVERLERAMARIEKAKELLGQG